MKKLNTHSPTFSILDWVTAFVALLLPFFVLYWMVPFAGKYTIGNDYLNYWINNQMFLRFSLSNGTFPLYAPGFNGGWTASALTLGQLYHPFSWLAAVIPGYWDGYAFQIGTILRLIELGITGAVLYLFLRKIRLTATLAFALSFITVYNLRMLDMFRYGASLENYTAFLLLCTAVCWFYLSPDSRFLPFYIAICSWLLVVGGHPQMMFIGFLGMVFILAIFPFYARGVFGDEQKTEWRKVLRFWGISAIWMLIGILLALPYILPFYFEYMKESNRGAGLDFNYACSCQDSVAGILCNFFNPFFSDVHGAFGGSAMILLAILVPLSAVFYFRRGWSVLVLWVFCIIVLMLSAGSNGLLYYYFWKYFPFTQTFRVPGRMSMVLPFVFMLILAWMLRQSDVCFRSEKHQFSFNPIVLPAIVALILLTMPKGIDYADLTASDRYVPANINIVPSNAVSLFFITGLITLVAVIMYGLSNRLKKGAVFFILASVIVASAAVLRYGTWIVPGNRTTKTFAQMQVEQRQRLSYRYQTGDLSRTLIEEHLKQTHLELAMARFCREYEGVNSQKESYQRMKMRREPSLAYVEGLFANEKNLQANRQGTDFIELKYNSFNNYIFDLTCAQPGFFVFSFPHSSLWQAIVDGRSEPIYRCNGIEQAILLSQGKHKIEFRYRSPATIAGLAIGSVSFLLIIWLSSKNVFNTKVTRLVLPAVLVFIVLLFLLWYRSLYNGANLGTYYFWKSPQVALKGV